MPSGLLFGKLLINGGLTRLLLLWPDQLCIDSEVFLVAGRRGRALKRAETLLGLLVGALLFQLAQALYLGLAGRVLSALASLARAWLLLPNGIWSGHSLRRCRLSRRRFGELVL